MLIGDLYSPELFPEPGPVLLERTPYGRRERRRSDGRDRAGHDITPIESAEHFVAAGLQVFRQDTRGRGDSGGTFVKYLPEAEDGFDTVEWIAAQPWCDGRVATTGVSYSAHAQSALAALAPPHLVAMFLDSGGMASAYATGIRFGGAFELKQATWGYRHALNSPEAAADPLLRSALADQDLAEWFTAMPWRRGNSPLRQLPVYENYLFEQWEHADFGPFWEHPSLYARGHYDRFPDIPSVHLGSWYDPYTLAAIENFTSLTRRGTRPVHLILGPWTHGGRSETFAGDVDFGPRATLDGNLAPDYLHLRSEWFARQLGLSDGAENPMPPVQYFLMGGGSGRRDAAGRVDHGGTWRTAQTWPPSEAVPKRLFLHETGVLSSAEPHAAEAPVTFPADPSRPVPTIGGPVTSGEPVMRGGAFDQTPDRRVFQVAQSNLPLSSRPDVVMFQTLPLTCDVAVVGPVGVTLSFSSSAPDTDITFKLIDVHPPTRDDPAGFCMNITDGILRCRYRNGFDRSVLMQPGETYQITVTAPDTANVFKAGHRIRLDISSSNFPRFDVNPNTGGPVAGSRDTRIARNTIHLNAARPSRMDLWTLPSPPQS